MRNYPSMSRVPVFGETCHIFEKLDGSLIRVEWTPKRGFRKFATKSRLIDASSEIFGEAVTLLEREEEKLREFFLTSLYTDYFEKLAKQERKRLVITLYGEFYGASSCFGTHDYTEPHTVSFFDVEVYRFGLLSASEFLTYFSKYLNTPIYFGEYVIDDELLDDIHHMRNEWSNLSEGVVCKYVDKDSGIVSMFKVKTHDWKKRLHYYTKGDKNLYEKLV